jgi:folate-binding protein YgfZ
MNADELVRELLPLGPHQSLERRDAPYRLVRVEGKDAAEFLHRLCSQDVLTLGDGELRPAAFLDAKGKLQVTCSVFRLADVFWLETHAERVERLAELLEKYHFTEKLTIARPDTGPCWEQVHWGAQGPVQNARAQSAGGKPWLLFERRGIAFSRVHGGAMEQVALGDDGRETAIVPRVLDEPRAECLRMLAGLLRVGVETEAATLALEADLDDHVSTTKGCYTGQEIVARIHTYGHVNRKACLLLLAPGAPVTAAQPLHEPDDRLAVGRVLHAVPIPGREERLGVGYLPKDFQALGTRLALSDGGGVEDIGWKPLADATGATGAAGAG